MKDLYFELNYGCLYEKIEGGSAEVFNFQHHLGEIRHLFIKREIPLKVDGATYYDIVTPYGYGGPVIIDCVNAEKKCELVAEFEAAFQEYCDANNIISEFVRFHPLTDNAKEFSSCYTMSFKSKTTGVTLANYDDPVQEEFSKSTRKAIQKALRNGVEYKVTPHPASLAGFQEIYLTTMKRLDAHELYFFDEEYFADCLKAFGENIILVEALFEGEVIGAELHFHYENKIHTHLSGSLSEYNHLSPVYVMTYAIALWGKENGVDLIHAGGGRSDDPEDSLFRFKKRFGKNTEFEYYTGTRIWNQDIYSELCALAGIDEDIGSFPAYREKSVVENR